MAEMIAEIFDIVMVGWRGVEHSIDPHKLRTALQDLYDLGYEKGFIEGRDSQ